MKVNNIQKPIEYFRANSQGLQGKESVIQRDGGKYEAGLIKGFSVITRGEALGHGMWIDDEFVESVVDEFSRNGVKSRYTHPGMSGDSLSKRLGRVYDVRLEEGQAFADLHIQKNAHKSPDGNLAEHVMEMAEEDPSGFGSSIVFEIDFDAQREFYDLHSEYNEESEEIVFKSPDELNTKNLPHARLKALRAVDIVDDPAANPDGLFCVDDVFKGLESFALFAMGLSDEKPASLNGMDPERAKSFFTGFLDSKGLALMSKENKPEELDTGKEEVEKVDPRKEAAEFMAKYGERGAVYYAEGLSLEECAEKRIEELEAADGAKADRIAELEAELVTAREEGKPVELGETVDKPKKGLGMESKVNFK